MDKSDQLKGTAVADIIEGSELSDLIKGLNGDDWLIGGLGRDSIFGGGDDDVIYAGENGISDSISPDDTELGIIIFDNVLFDNSLDGEGGDDLLLGSMLHDLQFGGSGDDNLRGYQGNDYLSGDAGNDVVRGHLGDDTLLGGSGDDVLLGHENDDFLDGGSGDDSLHGFNDHRGPSRSNIDTLTSGTGQDRFILGTHYETYYQLNENNDLGIITDFNQNQDVIQLHGEKEDYSLAARAIEPGGTVGTYIYYNVYTEGEAIAFVEEETYLDLDADYFEFV